MGFWSRIWKLVEPPPAYEYREGWIFDGKEVRPALLRQTCHPRASDAYHNGASIPAKGSGWWGEHRSLLPYREDFVFDTEAEALAYAIGKLDEKAAVLSELREKFAARLPPEG